MNIDNPSKVKVAAIAANLAALNDVMTAAAKRCAEAHELAQRGERNGAIGTLMDLGSALDEAKALYGAALALHRTKGLYKTGHARRFAAGLAAASPRSLRRFPQRSWWRARPHDSDLFW